MTDVLVGTGYGRVVGLRGDGPTLAAARAVLPFWWEESDAEPERVFDVVAPGAAGMVVRDLERWIAEHAVGFVFVHAAAVAIDGRALLLPGRSFAGKTTLCVELLTRGATYLSDEYAVLSHDGLVHPYPRPIQLRDDGFSRVLAAPSAFGAETAAGPLPVGVMALVTYDDTTDWDVDAIGIGAAVLRVLDHVLCARTRPEEALEAVSAVVATAHTIVGRRGEASTASARLTELVRRT